MVELSGDQKKELKDAIDLAVKRIPNSPLDLIFEDVQQALDARAFLEQSRGISKYPADIQDYAIYKESGASAYPDTSAFYEALKKDPRFQEACNPAQYPKGHDAMVDAAAELYGIDLPNQKAKKHVCSKIAK